MTWVHWCNSIHVERCVVYVNWFQLRGVRNQVVWSHIWLNVTYIPTDGSQYKWYRFAWALAFYQQERLKCRNTSMQHKIVNMLDPQSHHNPQPKRSSSSGTLNMIPSWNIHTVKLSMLRSCSNGCSLNWFTPSEFFQFSQISNQLVSLKNANDVNKRLNLVWVWN